MADQSVGQRPAGLPTVLPTAVSLVKPGEEFQVVDEVDLAGVADDRREDLRRREADAKLLAELRTDGFSGKKYAQFERELVAYALEVFQAWLATGHIFKLCADRGRHLSPSDQEFEMLRNKQYRIDTAGMTIGSALRTFKLKALAGGGWSSSGGASLTTYFMGAVIYAYGNVLRDDRAARNRQTRSAVVVRRLAERSRPLFTDGALDGDAAELCADPSFNVVSRMAVNDVLTSASERERKILALHLDGYTHQEIAEIMGERTARSIEGVIYRWRKRQQEMLSLEGAARGERS